MTDIAHHCDPATDGQMTRRRFLVGSALGGGLLLGFSLPAGQFSRAAAAALQSPGTAAASPAPSVTAWIQVGTDETITILVGSSEMGQGVLSGLAQIVAEELKVDWARVQSKHAPAEPIFANPVYHAQLTGGSASVRGYYTALRQVGAGAKAMLIQAAATAFEVSPSACVAASGKVIGPKAGQVMTYGQLATAAAQLTPPSNPPLTDPSKFVLIGTAVPRPDIPVKTTGAAVYGIDVRIPGMVYAAIKHCPTLGGTVAATPATPAGTFGVVNLGDAVAVLADSTYGAMRAASAITVSWNVPNGSSSVSDERISARAAQLLAGGPAVVAEAIGGDVTKALAGAVHSVDATYNLPYVPHACMEVLNCTVSVTPTSCEIWAPTQSQGPVAAIAASLTHLAASQVTVHTTFLGGGLGRKGETDFVVQAIKIAQVVGKPVHLTWSREEDFAHDFYRPMARIRVRAGLAADGSLVAWNNRIVSPSILAQKGWIPVGSVDSQAVEGAVGPAFPYQVTNKLVDYAPHPSPVPVSFWRSVGNSLNSFSVESAIDELALAAGVDPLALRLKLITNPRVAAVLRAAATLGGWGGPLPAGHQRGLAVWTSFGTTVAQVAEISSPTTGAIQVNKVACAVDCGQVINPDSVRAQMEGGIVHGLNAALYGRTRWSNGRATPLNFDDYRMLRLREMPAISVTIIPSTAPPSGTGEPGVPPIAPAIVNAYARLTGTRLRSLPLRGGG